MMALIFVLLMLMIMFAWSGYRRAAQYGFSLTLLLALMVFYHHLTAQLGLQL